MQMTLPETLLLQVFRSARVGRRPNLTALRRRAGASLEALEQAFRLLERNGLLTLGPAGETLSLPGLATAAALAARARDRHRPLAACRRLAA